MSKNVKTEHELIEDAIATRAALQAKWDKYSREISIVNKTREAWKTIMNSNELTIENKMEIIEGSGTEIISSNRNRYGLLVFVVDKSDEEVL